MYCSNCGKELIENANYCMFCGIKIIFPSWYKEKGVKEAKLQKSISASDRPLVKVDSAMLAMKLREYRKDMANLEEKPPYVIFNDKTLCSIINLLPVTKEELHNVYGFSNVKIEKYGQDIIDIINKLDMNNLEY